jgi:hypothetical protein
MRLGYRISLFAGALLAYVAVAAPSTRADDNQQRDADFAKRMFAEAAGQPKAFACFTRHYDAAHLAQHPQQKVSVMKLLVTSEKSADDKYLNYSFRLGVNFRNRPGDFDSSGDCGHIASVRPAEDADAAPIAAGIDFSCGVDCDGGGVDVALADKDASAIVKLDRIRIWKTGAPESKAVDVLEAGADDKVFRLDRANMSECTPLAADRKELAAMRHK